MSSDESSTNRVSRTAIMLVATFAAMAVLVAPASAASGQGTATIALADQAKGRTLSGQGVKILADSPVTKVDQTLTLPISAVNPGAAASATADGSLRFKRGKRSVPLSELSFDLTAGTLDGKLGKTKIQVFRLGVAPSVNSTTGAVAVSGGQLLLTDVAATVLRSKLKLKRALVRKGVGAVGLSAKANPTYAAAQPIVSGSAAWGVRSALRGYILSPPAGSISLSDGATANGPLTSPATIFNFPEASGSYVKGLYGASDKLQLKVRGAVTFAKPGHCIEALQFAELAVKVDGANSAITVDSTFDEGPGPCPDGAPKTTEEVELGKLNLTGIAPTYSANGQTVTWTAVPAAVTAAGETAFGGFLKTGAELEPITITVGLG